MDNVSKSVKNSDVLVIYFLSFLRFLCGQILIFIEFVTILLLFHVLVSDLEASGILAP